MAELVGEGSKTSNGFATLDWEVALRLPQNVLLEALDQPNSQSYVEQAGWSEQSHSSSSLCAGKASGLVPKNVAYTERCNTGAKQPLPPNWEQSTVGHCTYYINRRQQLKTWIRPTEDSPAWFPTVSSRIERFDARQPPPVPKEFREVFSRSSTGHDHLLYSNDRNRLHFEYPLKVYLVHSPIRPVRSFLSGIRRLGSHSKDSAITLITRAGNVSKPRRVFIIGCLTFWTTLWLFTLASLLVPQTLEVITRLGLLRIILVMMCDQIRRVVQFVWGMLLRWCQLQSAVLGSILGALTQIRTDQASWSHWRVVVGPYSYELKILEEARRLRRWRILDGDETEQELVEEPNSIYATEEEGEEEEAIALLPRNIHEGLDSPIATVSSHEDSDLWRFTEIDHQSSPLKTSSSVAGQRVYYANDGNRIVLATSRMALKSLNAPFKRQFCQCVKRILSKSEYDELRSDFNWMDIGKADQKEEELNEMARSVIGNWPEYEVADANCQAFALALLDRICSTKLSTISSRMCIRYAPYVQAPNIINVILGAGILRMPILGQEDTIHLIVKIIVVSQAWITTYVWGWRFVPWLFRSKMGDFLERHMRKYWNRAARLKDDSIEAKNSTLFHYLGIYTLVHVLTFLFVTACLFGIYYVAFIAPTKLILKLVSSTLDSTTRQEETEPSVACSLTLMPRKEYSFKKLLDFIPSVLLMFAYVFLWPVLWFKIMRTRWDPALLDAWYVKGIIGELPGWWMNSSLPIMGWNTTEDMFCGTLL